MLRLRGVTKSVSIIFFLISPIVASTLQAAIITVDAPDGAIAVDGVCSISEAIQAANSDTAVNECAAGDGVDTISLTSDINLKTTISTDYSNTGTAAIQSGMIIEGNNFSLQRDSSLPCVLDNSNEDGEFRILVVDASGDLKLNNIGIKNGCADGRFAGGGGTRSGGGGLFNYGTLSLDQVEFINNKAFYLGGGILNQSDAVIEIIENSVFDGNTNTEGGGAIHVRKSHIGIIRDSTFSNNSTTYNSSGIDVYFGTVDSIENNTFSGNFMNASASSNGGALSFNQSTINTLSNNTFSANSATFGGAIYTFDGIINQFNNNTFFENTASVQGVAILNRFSLTVMNMTNSLFINNAFTSPNAALECPDADSNFTGSNNLSDNPGSTCPGMLPMLLTAATVAPLADNGGPTFTHALLAGSEALDLSVAGTAMDQRGTPAFGVRDIGAYELQAIELCPTALQTDGFTTTVSDAAELIQAIECANLNGEDNGGDTIALGSDITLTQEYENHTVYGSTGTPPISSHIFLHGMGFKLVRDNTLNCSLDGINDPDEFRLMRVTSSGSLDLSRITISYGCVESSSHPDSSAGGALYNEGQLTIDTTVFSHNTSARNAGGVRNDGTISLVQNSVFSSNSSGAGGGLVNTGTINAVQNSTFSGNSATTDGGGIFNNGSISAIENSTFSGNSSVDPGAVIRNFNGSIMNLKNSLFHNNSNSIECSNIFGSITGSNNLSDNLSGGCPGLMPDALTSATVGSLADNGGPNMTHALLVGSEALNIAVSGTATDQRGFDESGVRDIGAFEAQPPMAVAPPDVSVEATGPLTSPVLGSAMVTDVDEPGVIATASQASDFPVGMTTVTWTAIDTQGFAGSDTQIVTIIDTTPPVVTSPAAVSLEATGPTTAVNLGIPSAIDLVDGTITAAADMTGPFAVGTYTVTWSATDAAFNTGTDTQLVTITDSTAPNLSLVGSDPVTVLVGDTYNDAGATATDLVDDDSLLTVAIVVDNPVDTSAAGTYVIEYNVADSAGNTATTLTRTVNVLATVGGTLTGLAAGNVVEIQNNGGDSLIVNSDGGFTFTTPLVLNATYNVTVLTQPMSPEQTCSVSSGSGTIIAGNINSIVINCTTNSYTISGTLSGLAVGNEVVLQNNADDDLIVNSNGSFTFSTPLDDGRAYAVTISQQPGNQSCVVNTGSGTIAGDDVTDVEINCSDNSISLSSNLLTYGELFVGSQSTNTVTVTNNGSADVAITGFSDPAAPFRLTGGSCTQFPVTLIAGESCVIDVLFNPTSEGSFNGSFQIISNASSSPNVVSLSGTSQILAIPTLSHWALVLMALLMLGMAYKKRQFF